MKIVRSGAFETNSSSTHSLTLNHKQKEKTYYMFDLTSNLSTKEELDYNKLVKAFPFTYEVVAPFFISQCYNTLSELDSIHLVVMALRNEKRCYNKRKDFSQSSVPWNVSFKGHLFSAYLENKDVRVG